MADQFGDARPLDLHVVIEAECPGGSRTVARTCMSDHVAAFDEPGPIGSDTAITPVQGWLGAILGSTNVILRKCAGRHGVEVAALKLTLAADIDRRGMAMEEEVELPFRSVTITHDLVTDAADAAIAAVRADLAKYCSLHKMLRAAGTELNEVWNITRP